MAFLVFQLQGHMAAWGEPAIGESRGTGGYPSHSAIVGLLAAALGIDRHDEASQAGLRDGYGMAVAVLETGSLLRDYHTAQVPPRTALKGRPHHTRRQELAPPKQQWGTMLSTRDYRQDAACLVALQPSADGAHAPTLEALAAALRSPKFVLYLGRRSCPPAAPLWPQVIEAASALVAFRDYGRRHEAACQSLASLGNRAALDPLGSPQRMSFDDRIEAGIDAELSAPRKDRIIRREGWQFGDRIEHIAILAPQS